MRRTIMIAVAALTVWVTAAAAQAAPVQAFTKVAATTAGDSLFISFVERGLDAGQNYAYSGSGTLRETFRCYRSASFTPTHRTKTVGGSAAPDARAYTANANGIVRGFIYLDSTIVWPDFCGLRQEAVPVHVCYLPEDLVDIVQPFDVYYFPDGTRICGAIEPD
jgi:hypothetical protein